MGKYKIDIKFIEASDWPELLWYHSGGTRAKKILQDPTGNEHFFKCSEKKEPKDGKPAKYYKYEFWNEIIAYQLGKNLGLDVLRYDAAVFEGEIGCLSPKMINSHGEQLIELGRFMTAINSNFLPENTQTRSHYTFQLLTETLDYFDLSKYLPFIFQTLIFDAIIGNTDRHQENWAFIGNTTILTEVLSQVEQEVKSKGFQKLPWPIRQLYKRYFDKTKAELSPDGKLAKLIVTKVTKNAPIYDNGSSLARELTDNRVNSLLNNEKDLSRYIEKGNSELHWNGQKLTHFELIKVLLNSSYTEQVNKAAEFLQNWDNSLILRILEQIDTLVPENWKNYCIPDNRKMLISKLLTLRFQNLTQILSD